MSLVLIVLVVLLIVGLVLALSGPKNPNLLLLALTLSVLWLLLGGHLHVGR